MLIFDPFAWAERLLPAPWLHRTIRGMGVALCAVFLVLRVREYHAFRLKALWAVETAVFVVLILAFLLRVEPVDRSRGWREIVVPLAGAALPFGLLFAPPHAAVARSQVLLPGVFWWMAGATALTVWGMWTLRRSFSITVEARRLVTGGPYRWIRHPIYLGEMLTAAAVCLWRFSPANLVLFTGFVATQLLRARWEEVKLRSNFSDYRSYANRCWWFW